MTLSDLATLIHEWTVIVHFETIFAVALTAIVLIIPTLKVQE